MAHGPAGSGEPLRSEDQQRDEEDDDEFGALVTLVVHGTQDRILPFEATAQRLPALIDDLELVAVEGGPHNIGWTRHDEVNDALLEFLGAHRLTTSSV